MPSARVGALCALAREPFSLAHIGGGKVRPGEQRVAVDVHFEAARSPRAERRNRTDALVVGEDVHIRVGQRSSDLQGGRAVAQRSAARRSLVAVACRLPGDCAAIAARRLRGETLQTLQTLPSPHDDCRPEGVTDVCGHPWACLGVASWAGYSGRVTDRCDRAEDEAVG